jgi:ABC-type sulfate transport system permease component
MKEGNESVRGKVILGLQIFLLVCFYMFALGVLIFLGWAIYRSVVNNDHTVHAIVLSSVITFAFLIITSVMTMVFTVIIKEGQRKARENGGAANESKI